MGRFDDYEAVAPAPTTTTGEIDAGVLAALEALARSIPHPYGLKTRDYRALLVECLTAEGWTCRTHVRVDSRGTDDGYAGILDLVAHPPAPPGSAQLPHPVLVEIDKASIQAKTLAKLAHWPHHHAGKVIILTRAQHHPAVHGVDRLIGLA